MSLYDEYIFNELMNIMTSARKHVNEVLSYTSLMVAWLMCEGGIKDGLFMSYLGKY